MSDTKKHLPVVQGPPAGGGSSDGEWHWVPLSALLVSALSLLLLFVALPLVVRGDFQRIYGEALPSGRSEALGGLRRIPRGRAEALVNRVALTGLVLFTIAGAITGVVVGRFKKTRRLLEAPLGMLVAAGIFAALARQAAFLLWLAPLMAGGATLGALLGRSLRKRARA